MQPPPRLGPFLAGLMWGAAVLYVGGELVRLPVFTAMTTTLTAFIAPGAVLAVMLGVWRWRGPGSGPKNPAIVETGREIVLALCLWPGITVLMGGRGPGLVTVLGLALAVQRLVAWGAAGRFPALAAFAGWASFLPTAMALLWALLSISLAAARLG